MERLPLRTSKPSNCGPDSFRILVVDDERINRELLRGVLQRSGYEVFLARDGAEALFLIQQVQPNLVLLDVVMSPLSGFDVLHKIRETYQDTELPVLMVTAEADRTNIISAFRGGANDYLTKPLDPEVALARVSLHLRLRNAQAELERSQERYLMAAEGSRIGLWDWDLVREQLFLSTRLKEMLGFVDEDFPGDITSWLDRIHPADRRQLLELLQPMAPVAQRRFECEMRMLHRNDGYRWMQCAGVVQADEVGHPRRLAGSLADITEGKVRDVLTGLPNRLLFEERLNQALRRSLVESQVHAVLFLDLDKFKLVNDSLGHDAGDLLLCSVSRRLENCLRLSDRNSEPRGGCFIARHGGDEFTVLLERLQAREEAEVVALRIIRALSDPFKLHQHDVSIGVSIGIAFLDERTFSAADCIREADTAMYHAKTAGRGKHRVYDPGMQAIAAERLTLESDLRQALKSDEFYPVYQPVIELATGCVDGFEALCRWKHPRGESIGPEVFIPVLESLSLVGEQGKYLLSIAGLQIQEWNQRIGCPPPLTISINCSTREFIQPRFKLELLSRVAEIGIDARLLRLEVTEGTLMESPDVARDVINELRASGMRVGLDDFGTGYSSLSYLHRLPLDQLKIDKSFVKSMQLGNESYEIVRTIIALAQGLNLDIVAEGVETEAQHDMLKSLGCSHAQGYLYSRPLPAETITALIQKGQRIPMQAIREANQDTLPVHPILER